MHRIVQTLAVSALALSSQTANAQTKDLVDLGAVAPGLGINNSGEVVMQNYIYGGGMLTAFPGGFTGAAINADGVVAGSAGLDNTGGAAIYNDGTVTIVISQTGAGELGCNFATGINHNGDIVGYLAPLCATGFPSSPTSAWVYSDGMQTGISATCAPGLRLTDTDAIPYGINDSGEVTGIAPTCSTGVMIGGGDAFIYSSGKLTDLGIGGPGIAINEGGEVTGSSNGTAFIYSNGKVTLLIGSVSSACSGNAINASGLVVGTCKDYPFLYNGSTVTNLNTLVPSTDPLKPYVTLADARGISDGGLIVVNGADSRDMSQHVYLMQISASATIAPAGSSIRSGGGAFDSRSLLFLSGLVASRVARRWNLIGRKAKQLS